MDKYIDEKVEKLIISLEYGINSIDYSIIYDAWRNELRAALLDMQKKTREEDIAAIEKITAIGVMSWEWMKEKTIRVLFSLPTNDTEK